MNVVIMQPYFFPYIGYFQLIAASQKFIFYDDVNYIKGGWVNRNRILISNDVRFFNAKMNDSSPNKFINKIALDEGAIWRKKILMTITHSYSKAPFFKEIFPLVESVLFATNSLSELNILSTKAVCNYLSLHREFKVSSQMPDPGVGLRGQERVLHLCKQESATSYINAINGQNLYSREDFESQGIRLFFIRTKEEIVYRQFSDEFAPNLSIIDVLMFNPIEKVKEFTNHYNLI